MDIEEKKKKLDIVIKNYEDVIDCDIEEIEDKDSDNEQEVVILNVKPILQNEPEIKEQDNIEIL